MLSTPEVKERIVEHITETLEDVGIVITGLSGSEELNSLGISSMIYARLVLRLEAEFGIEVFSGAEQPPQVRTVDELVNSFARAIV